MEAVAATGAWREDTALYRAMIDHLPDAVILFDASGSVKIANMALARLSGFEAGDLVDASIFTLFPPHISASIRAEIERLIGGQSEESGPIPVELIRHDGHVSQGLLTLHPIPKSDGREPHVQGVLRKMAQEERTRQELEAIQEVLRVIAGERNLDTALKRVLGILSQRRGYARGSIWTVNADWLTLSLRAALTDDVPASTRTDKGIVGRVVRSRQPVFLPDVSADPEYIAISPIVVSEICVPILYEERLIGVIDMESDAFNLLEERDLRFLELLATQIAALIERAELQTHLERQATTDPVTGLPNRQAFQQALEQATSNAHRGPVSVLVLGVDGFKSTNDLYGHTIADDILRQIGQILKSRISPGHLLARHTSDQFAVLLPGIGREDAVTIAENLRIGVAMQLFTAAEQVEQLTVSVGAASCPDDAATAPGILQAADHVMYLAKRAGRNQTFQSNAALASLSAAHGRLNDLLRQSPKETLVLLVRAMDQRIPERAGHAERVTRYALAIARQLGLPEEDLAQLRTAAYIHDIGMMSLPDALLRKPMSLSPDERRMLRSVPVAARGLLSQLDLPESVLSAVVHLRENWDGSGHPAGLAGETIPIGARIIAVADAIDAMTSPRAHRAPMTIEQALEQVQHQAGSQFDPSAASAASVITDVIRSPFTPDDPSIILTDVDRVQPAYPEIAFEAEG